jgi:hypothetical protein
VARYLPWNRVALSDERGMALPLALAVSAVVAAMLSTIMFATAASYLDGKRSNAAQTAYALAEAGINNAFAVLNANYPGTIGYPGDPNLLAARTTTLGAGSATWSGTLVAVTGQTWGYEWHLTSTGTIPNPTGPGTSPVTRTVKAAVPVYLPNDQQNNGSSPLNWIYAGTNINFSQSLQVASPVYAVGDVSLANSAKITGAAGKIGVGGNLYQSTVQNQIGLTGGSDPRLAEAHVVGKCSVKGNVLLHDCGGTPTATNWDVDSVFASSTSHSLTGLLDHTPSLTCCGSTSDMGFWYSGSDLGPTHACTSGSVPFQFESTVDTAINNSATPVTPINLTPSTTTYSCSTSTGTIAWDSSAKKLRINGTIFIDGSATVDSSGYSGNPVFTYTGTGTIVLSGTFAMKGAKMCAVTSGSDCNWSTSAWNPNSTALAVVADGDGANGGAQSQSNVVPNGYGIVLVGSSSFQGALLAAKSITTAQTAQEEGPMISVYSTVDAGQSGTLTFPSISFAPSAAYMIANGTPPRGQLLTPINYGG